MTLSVTPAFRQVLRDNATVSRFNGFCFALAFPTGLKARS
jgi:hypothetical protein